MANEIVELTEDVSSSPLYSEDLAPVPADKRTWNKWSLAALWVGMAVCIPTYLLASYMIKSGMDWLESLIIIGLANIIITIPMVLNGHAGVKYGIPFPVVSRSSFGINGVHFPSIARGIVACGWFGVQTWIGGLAIYELIYAFSETPPEEGLNFIKFACFGIFWFINMFFIWKGTESIKWLEEWSAPILLLMAVALIIWGAVQAGGFGNVLDQAGQMKSPSAILEEGENGLELTIQPLTDKTREELKAHEYELKADIGEAIILAPWRQIQKHPVRIQDHFTEKIDDLASYQMRVREPHEGGYHHSSWITLNVMDPNAPPPNKLWDYVFWLTVMLGFWATMSLSIADITRYAPTQKSQKAGQFIGLPGTMMLYSFAAIFVTFAAAINFDDVLIAEDAPWDPTALLGKFESPWVVVISQLFMVIATLSTNIAANVIAPSNAFSNLLPKKISFKTGGTITGLIGIIICPWWIMDDISNLLIFVSGLLGPVLGIMLCDYFAIRRKNLSLADLYKKTGIYSYGHSGFNWRAMAALGAGIFAALVWHVIPALSYLSNLAWFSGFVVAFIVYYLLMKSSAHYQLINKN